MTRGAARLLLALLLAGASRAARAEDRESASFQNVVVKPGDTLWSISHAYLKDPSRWDEILKHNRLPTADPTVALPGMVLRVPVKLIKTNLRAAHLVYAINRVLFRRKETADWRNCRTSMELFQGDFLRTLEESRARVKFLNREILSLEPNSMAVIKPVEDEAADVVLKSGSVFAGRARVVTANARVTPRTRDTRYSASVEPDLTTKVEVFKGAAGVEAQGGKVEVAAGMQTSVRPGLAPEIPKPLENLPELEARAQEYDSAVAVGGGPAPNPRTLLPPPEPEADADSLRGDVDSLHVGVPILGFHMQASKTQDFRKIAFDRKYDSDERFSSADSGLAPGAYWWRVAIVDLLGVEGPYSEPRYYSVGIKRPERREGEDLGRMLTIVSPEEGEFIDDDHVRFTGVLRDDRLRLEIGGHAVRIDADGNFVATVPLHPGLNQVVLIVTDGKGNETRVSRRVNMR